MELRLEPKTTQELNIRKVVAVSSALAVTIFAIIFGGSLFKSEDSLAQTQASSVYWTNSSGDGLWSTGSNWSSGNVPNNGKKATFNSTSSDDCIIDTDISVHSIIISSSYSGEITQSSGVEISVQDNWEQDGGSFIGGDSEIHIDDDLKLDNCDFTSTTGTLKVEEDLIIDSDVTFDHNSGLFQFASHGAMNVQGDVVLNDMTINSSQNAKLNILSNTEITVVGTTTFSGNKEIEINGNGKLVIQGDWTISNTNSSNESDGTIEISGSANQSISSSSAKGKCELPDIVINKTGGVATFSGTFTTNNDWTYTTGNVDFHTNDATLVFNYKNQSITGEQSFGNLELDFSAHGDLDLNDDITIKGDLIYDASKRTNIKGGKTLSLEGDLILSGSNQGQESEFLLKFNGTSDQDVLSSASEGKAELDHIEIDKTGGTLSMEGTISVRGNWTYTGGTTDLATGESQIVFTHKDQEVNGSQEFYDLKVDYDNHGDFTINDDITVAGEFNFHADKDIDMLGDGSILSEGDIELSGGNQNCTSVIDIVVTGSNDQLLDGAGNSSQSEIGSLIINKTGGTLTIKDRINLLGDFIYVSGNVNATTEESMINMRGDGAIIDGEGSGGVVTLYDLRLSPTSNTSMELQGDIKVSNQAHLYNSTLYLNGHDLYIDNASTSGLTRSSGGIVSESNNHSGTVSWNLGSNSSTHTVPFEDSIGNSINFQITIQSGDAGIVSMSTYGTDEDNGPYPSGPDTVATLGGDGTTDNSTNTIDRFWQITKTGTSATAKFRFYYDQNEVTGGVNGLESYLVAYSYDYASDWWNDPEYNQSASAGGNWVQLTGTEVFGAYTLATSVSSLPVELLEFTAKLHSNGTVDLNWATAMEENNEYFTIERSEDGENFVPIGTKAGAGNSNEILYYGFNDFAPAPGLNYYRLKQTDYDGTSSYSEIQVVDASKDKRVSVYPNPFTDVINVSGVKNPVINVYDMKGSVVLREETNQLNVEQLIPGTYIIQVFSGDQLVHLEKVIKN